MKCDCVPEWDDGEVTTITWAGNGSSDVMINACGVKIPGVWYAAYAWDGISRVLHLSTPTKTVPAAPAQLRERRFTDDPPQIVRLNIDCWGSSRLGTPLDWEGPTAGIATIAFHIGPQISGPVGGVNGP